jgi:CheY-like chemotaxis protein
MPRLILIADDDRDQRECVVELVTGLGAEVLEAETGAEALSILRERRLHLALLDQHMPGHTGLELLTFVRDETLHVPCILLSGEANEIMRKQALHDGAIAVFKKPFEADALRAEVRRALALSA